jgi:hypothetical protein
VRDGAGFIAAACCPEMDIDALGLVAVETKEFGVAKSFVVLGDAAIGHTWQGIAYKNVGGRYFIRYGRRRA